MDLREILTPYQQSLPALNASLNGCATLLLCAGRYFIYRRQIRAHMSCMIGAVAISTLFLISYVTYHWLKEGLVTRFDAGGAPELIYKFILLTHVILAAITPVLVILTLVPALRSRFDKHRRIARITFPVWMYVSVTGVFVYLMLYQWYPPATL